MATELWTPRRGALPQPKQVQGACTAAHFPPLSRSRQGCPISPDSVSSRSQSGSPWQSPRPPCPLGLPLYSAHSLLTAHPFISSRETHTCTRCAGTQPWHAAATTSDQDTHLVPGSSGGPASLGLGQPGQHPQRPATEARAAAEHTQTAAVGSGSGLGNAFPMQNRTGRPCHGMSACQQEGLAPARRLQLCPRLPATGSLAMTQAGQETVPPPVATPAPTAGAHLVSVSFGARLCGQTRRGQESEQPPPWLSPWLGHIL